MTFLGRPPIKSGSSKCFYCGRILRLKDTEDNKPTWDHVLPVCRGGLLLPVNLILSCQRCNGDKGALTLEEYRQAIVVLKNIECGRKNMPLRFKHWKFWAERPHNTVEYKKWESESFKTAMRTE